MKHSSTLYKTLGAILTFAITIISASAQLHLHCVPAKSDFIAYEDTKIHVTITNKSGQPLNLRNTSKAKWIEFIVEKGVGKPIHSARNFQYNNTTIPTGKSITSSFSINQAYDLSQPGNYSAYAIVRTPGQTLDQGFRSKRIFFNITKGFASWKQRVGAPGIKGSIREFRIMNVINKENSQLYVQLEDIEKRQVLATFSMGRYLNFRKFEATFDKQNNLHVLFLTQPTLHCHTVINTKGKTILREYHKKGPTGLSPNLTTTVNGVVGVLNSTLYNPEEKTEQRKRLHNLSELPVGL